VSRQGFVYIVGAGPGDPELITVKGLTCLRKSDVIVHDRLVHPALLEEAQALANALATLRRALARVCSLTPGGVAV
jgi:siroheme synthase